MAVPRGALGPVGDHPAPTPTSAGTPPGAPQPRASQVGSRAPEGRLDFIASPLISTTVVKTNATQACKRAVASRAIPLGRVAGKKTAGTAGVEGQLQTFGGM